MHNDKITSFKKARAYLGIEETATCAKCSQKNECRLKDKVPQAGVTSSKDVLMMVHSMMRQAVHEEKHKAKEDTEEKSTKGENDQGDGARTNFDESKLLKDEADKQMREFFDEVNQEEPTEPHIRTQDEELALYVAGIRLVHGLPLIISESLEHKQEILDVLETSIQEFTTRKRIDTIVRLQRGLDKTSSKKHIKREENRGIHELIDRSKLKMEQFSKSLPSDK